MNFAKPLGSAKIDKMEVETNGNIRELRDNAAFHQAAGGHDEMTPSDLSTLLDRVAGTSAREIDSLIGELQLLRKKLQADGSRKPIDEIQSGDKVLAFNEIAGATYISPVVKTFHHTTRIQQLHHFTLSDGRTFTSNDIHPILVVEKNQWLRASEIYSL